MTRTPLPLHRLRLALRALAAVSLVASLSFAWRAHQRRVVSLEIRATPEYWARAGFVEMVPPLRLPGRAALELETRVWLRLPEHSLLEVTRDSSSGRPLLHYPEGAEAVRVETARSARGTSVADARGIRFGAQGSQLLYVLRPHLHGEPTALRGYSWPRADGAAQIQAEQLMGPAVRGLACAACHVPARPDAARVGEFGEVARGTDGAGLFQVQTVLADRVPVESYAPRERNAGDPNLVVHCGAAPAALSSSKFGPVFSCPNDALPVGTLDVSRGVQSGDARVLALCHARRYLYDHLDVNGRAAFREAFRACGI